MNQQKEIQQLLSKYFPTFEKELVEKICEVGVLENVKANEVLMEPGKYVKFIPLLCEGIVEVYRDDSEGREVLLYYLKPGEVCSAMISCCMTNLTSEVHARATESCVMIRIPISIIDQWMHMYSSWKTFVFTQYRLRFNELLQTIDSLAFLKMDERLVRYFKNMYKTSNKTIFEGSHSDIAQSLSTSREVISRLLKSLEHQGKVSLNRNRIDFSGIL